MKRGGTRRKDKETERKEIVGGEWETKKRHRATKRKRQADKHKDNETGRRQKKKVNTKECTRKEKQRENIKAPAHNPNFNNVILTVTPLLIIGQKQRKHQTIASPVMEVV